MTAWRIMPSYLVESGLIPWCPLRHFGLNSERRAGSPASLRDPLSARRMALRIAAATAQIVEKASFGFGLTSTRRERGNKLRYPTPSSCSRAAACERSLCTLIFVRREVSGRIAPVVRALLFTLTEDSLSPYHRTEEIELLLRWLPFRFMPKGQDVIDCLEDADVCIPIDGSRLPGRRSPSRVCHMEF